MLFIYAKTNNDMVEFVNFAVFQIFVKRVLIEVMLCKNVRLQKYMLDSTLCIATV